MLVILLVSFALAMLATLLVIRSSRRHASWSADHDLSGPQKFHAVVVPRIGGVGIFLGWTFGVAILATAYPTVQRLAWLFWLCSWPAFGAGLLEDFTKRVSPLQRLLATMVAAALGAVFMGALIERADVPGLDVALALPLLAWVVTLVVVAGLAHSVNIIDGMNGLASMCSVIMLAGIGYVASLVGDVLIAGLALSLLGAILGFFVWNYPRGLIFLGDGGAYLLGFALAELGILLSVRNPEVSPVFALLLCWYPMLETLFSMYRRKVVRGRPVSMPDGIHLHSLIYRRLMRWAVGISEAKVLTRRNSMTSPYLWVLCSMSVVPAVLWWNNTWVLAGFVVLFTGSYVYLYGRIVRFKTPSVLVVKN